MLVPRQLLDSVVFLGIRGGEVDDLGGTAFFVSVPAMANPARRHVYLVTARHSIDGQVNLFARLNAPLGGTLSIDLPDGDHWLTHPGPAAGQDYVDLAATKIPSASAHEAHLAGYGWVPLSMFFTEDLIGDDVNSGVGIGDEVVTIGLFTRHYGDVSNEPVVRTGNLAMVPGEPMVVRYTKHAINRRMRLYLTELRSIEGLSGSPVFIRHRNFIGAEQTQVSLLGVMSGHWDDGDRNHVGFGMVVPADLLAELINQEDEMKERSDEENSMPAVAGTAVADSGFASEDEYGRFEALARKLVNTPKPKQEEKPE